jgi:membrane protein
MPTSRTTAKPVKVAPADKKPPPPQERRPLIRLAWMAGVTVRAYFTDKVPRLGAALAFYTTVAVAPLLMIAIAISQVVFREDNARQRIIGEIELLLGTDAGRALETVQPPSTAGHSPTFATALGIILLVIGGLGVFANLQDALNTIWRSPEHTGESWAALLKRRVFSFGTVIVTGFILLVSLTMSAALTWVGENARGVASWPAGVWEMLNFVLSFGVITYLFAIIFKLLPDVTIRWRDVWTGAAVTAVLFVAGKTVLGIYLAHSKVTSAFGAAGSLMALLLWCYYAAQILFIGAEFTRVHALTRGGRDPLPTQPPAV